MSRLKKFGVGTAFVLFVIFIFCLGNIGAVPSFPFPVTGKVIVVDKILPFTEVTLTVCDWRGSTLDNCIARADLDPFVSETDSTGAYVFALENIYPGYRGGDILKVRACNGHSLCEYVFEIQDKDTFKEINFDIDSRIPDKEAGPDTIIIDVPEEDDVTVVIADEEISVDDLEEVEKLRWWNGWIAIICYILLAVGGAGTAGYKAAKKRLQTTIKGVKSKKYKGL
jgi:hypothetical protein